MDVSEKAYSSVQYLKVEEEDGKTDVSFVMAASRVAPVKSLFIPRLELSAALTGAQLSIQSEFMLPLHQRLLWTNSTVVLKWQQLESTKSLCGQQDCRNTSTYLC